MKASGFRPAIAGAIEAMNSTGGQIVHPVMGAGAFLMAEILGIPYGRIALVAIPQYFALRSVVPSGSGLEATPVKE